jgi:hypothetical protein
MMAGMADQWDMLVAASDDDGITIVYYGGSGYICTPSGGRKWLYEQAREKYIRTGDVQALADMLRFTQAG